MGLDIVELVMEVEAEFDISIPDSDAEQIITVGDLHSYILAKKGEGVFDFCPSSCAFYRLRRAFMSGMGVRREQVVLAAPMEGLLPREERRQHWRRLEESLGGWRLPKLERPSWVTNTAIFLTMGLMIALVLGIFLHSEGFPSAALAAFATTLVVAVLLALTLPLTEPLAVEFPSNCANVRGLTETLLRRNFGRLASEAGGLPRDEVWTRLVRIISENLGVPAEQITPEDRFLEDLGAD